MICIAFLKRDILHAGTFREDESIGLSLCRDFGFVIMQTITWEKKSPSVKLDFRKTVLNT